MQSLGETRIADVETYFLLLVAKYLSFGFFFIIYSLKNRICTSKHVQVVVTQVLWLLLYRQLLHSDSC